MRTLSILAFSDSKALAQGGWDTRPVGAAQAFGAVNPTLSHGDTLEALGILTNPSSRLIGGGVALVLDSGTIDLAALECGGFSISEDQARRARSIPGARALLEVENLSCFHELCRDPVRGVLVVYGEGFATNGSFDEVARAFSRCTENDATWLAWSDIDAGGFEITSALMARYPRFKPFLMDASTLDSVNSGYLLRRDGAYTEDYLQPWLDRERAECFRGACERCIELGATLEQEILLEGRRVQSELHRFLATRQCMKYYIHR